MKTKLSHSDRNRIQIIIYNVTVLDEHDGGAKVSGSSSPTNHSDDIHYIIIKTSDKKHHNLKYACCL